MRPKRAKSTNTSHHVDTQQSRDEGNSPQCRGSHPRCSRAERAIGANWLAREMERCAQCERDGRYVGSARSMPGSLSASAREMNDGLAQLARCKALSPTCPNMSPEERGRTFATPNMRLGATQNPFPPPSTRRYKNRSPPACASVIATSACADGS